jgi:hypothetical protein
VRGRSHEEFGKNDVEGRMDRYRIFVKTIRGGRMEPIYKKSKYIIENTAADGQVYFYSTNTGGMVSVSTKKYEKFVELLNDSKKMTEPLKQCLIETGMLVPAEINEHDVSNYMERTDLNE